MEDTVSYHLSYQRTLFDNLQGVNVNFKLRNCVKILPKMQCLRKTLLPFNLNLRHGDPIAQSVSSSA